MKKIIAILLFAASAFGVGFPIFIGDQSDYMTNTGGSIVFVYSNSARVIYYRGTPRVDITNNILGETPILGLGTKDTNGNIRIDYTFGDGAALGFTWSQLFTTNGFQFLHGSGECPITFSKTSQTFITSNLNALATTVSGWSKTIQTVSGTGGANTNFTIQSQQGMVFFDLGTTNASLTIMGGETTRAWEGAFVGTNRTATDRTLAFSAVSNSWRSVTHYDGVSTNGETLTCTNNTAIAGWWRIVGSNVLVALKHVSLPAP